MKVEPAAAIMGHFGVPGDKSISHRAVLLAAVARLVLPVRRVGLLVVRSRAFDVLVLSSMGVALVVFASWRPGKALLGALLFAFFDALQLRLQQSCGEGVPYQIYLMLPYVLSIAALIVASRRATAPQALTVTAPVYRNPEVSDVARVKTLNLARGACQCRYRRRGRRLLLVRQDQHGAGHGGAAVGVVATPPRHPVGHQ